MDVIGPVIDIVNRAWDCCRRCTSYLRNLRENLNALEGAMGELRNVRDDVKEKVDLAEAQRMVRTHVVDGWLQRVEGVEAEVDEALQEGYRQIEERCLRGCCPKNCWKSYKFGKEVVEKLSVVNKLKNVGKFDEVANALPGVISSQLVPEYPTVGMEMLLERVLKLLEDNDVRIMGLYGIGGVGKTTLLKKIKNKFVMKRSHDVVIWVVVSKEVNVGKIQKEIGKELGFSWKEDELQNERTETIFSMLSRKKFVLLLDDCWERVDLEMIGIPHPRMGNKGDKIVFTTRSEIVCGHMEATKKIRVECLDPEKAWDLFSEKVGVEALNLHPEIRELAARVANECDGLPLALITIGRTMASKKTPQEWKHALTILQKSTSEFLGMGDEVFPLLKFSYDSLKDDAHKSCFLYYSLFPEDYEFSMEELIWYWIGEGFFDGCENNEEAFNKGMDVIGSLTAVCLFEFVNVEKSHVKMHDVIRDLAIWIGCECGRKKNKFLVRTGANLSKVPPFEQWKEAERVSLIYNDIKCLEDPPISFNNLLTLNLGGNTSLCNIRDDFFRSTPKLKVLNFQDTGIAHFPVSITYLFELQFLNLRGTNIKSLPNEFVKLVNLKILNLAWTRFLSKVPAGMISCLSKLQYLNLFDSAFKTWGFGGDSDGEAASLVELEGLEQLITLSLSVNSTGALQKLVNCDKFQMCVNALGVIVCEGLVSLILSLSSSSSFLVSSSTSSSFCLGSMKNLQHLTVRNCLLKEIVISWARVEEESSGQVSHGLLSKLGLLELQDLPNLSITWAKGVISTHPHFQKLSQVYITRCDALIDLTWLLFAPCVWDLHVRDCKGLTKIVDVKEVAVTVENLNLFSRLLRLQLQNLPCLRFIVDGTFPFPSLTIVFVENCPKLKKLPFDSNSARNTLQVIVGSDEWWEALEWKDESIRSSFLSYFEPI